MKNSKQITRLLLVLILGIWGTIAYRVYDSVTTNDAQDISISLDKEVGKQLPEGEYIYVNDVRDPFRYVSQVRRDTSLRTAMPKPKVVWTPPPLKLTGILLANKKKTVMLEGANGSAFFLHEGDTLSGVKIMKIREKGVSYIYQKKSAEWSLIGSY